MSLSATEPTITNFFNELDKLCDTGGSTENRMKQTTALLKVGDDLFDANKVINQRIKDGSFITNICGTTRIEEMVDGTRFNRPVVDLVQQGGTMLGIGLLGYTYIMEKAGVRFRSMAGTSAGAINTLLLSEMLAHLVANTDFSKFLDRKGIIGRIQGFMVKRINSISKIMPVLIILIPVLLLAVSYLFYRLLDKYLFNSSNNLTEKEINNYNFIGGTLGIVAVLLLAVVIVFSLFRKHMGVNPGNEPYNWMKSILSTNYVGIYTTEELLNKKKNEPRPINDAPDDKGTIVTTELSKDPRLVFITANLTHNRIVKFPENNTDYWDKNYAGLVCPAAYVRASMSLPFIFYAFIPDNKYLQSPPPLDTVNLLARFVDGGMLSNFPIREFHVPPPQVPHYPTFGVLLGSSTPEPVKDTKSIKQKFLSLSVFKYILSFISTFRNFYDADFLRTHAEFSMLVKAVNTDDFNSLDFGMPFDTKKKIFAEGAKTAIAQLEAFNWQDYLAVRMGNPPITVKPGL
jgi:NTE family protein